MQHRAHRRPYRLPIERIGGRRIEHHTACAERQRIAEDPADVVMDCRCLPAPRAAADRQTTRAGTDQDDGRWPGSRDGSGSPQARPRDPGRIRKPGRPRLPVGAGRPSREPRPASRESTGAGRAGPDTSRSTTRRPSATKRPRVGEPGGVEQVRVAGYAHIVKAVNPPDHYAAAHHRPAAAVAVDDVLAQALAEKHLGFPVSKGCGTNRMTSN